MTSYRPTFRVLHHILVESRIDLPYSSIIRLPLLILYNEIDESFYGTWGFLRLSAHHLFVLSNRRRSSSEHSEDVFRPASWRSAIGNGSILQVRRKIGDDGVVEYCGSGLKGGTVRRKRPFIG